MPGVWESLWGAGEGHFRIAQDLLQDVLGRMGKGSIKLFQGQASERKWDRFIELVGLEGTFKII